MTRELHLSSSLPYELMKFAIGAEPMLNRFVTTSTWNDQNSYPPYNIIKHDDYKWTVEVALSGFSEDDIQVEVKDGTLEIRSCFETKEDSREYAHKGIAKRKFVRKFALGEDVVANTATMANGLLSVDLERIVPEEKKPRLIAINKV